MDHRLIGSSVFPKPKSNRTPVSGCNRTFLTVFADTHVLYPIRGTRRRLRPSGCDTTERIGLAVNEGEEAKHFVRGEKDPRCQGPQRSISPTRVFFSPHPKRRSTYKSVSGGRILRRDLRMHLRSTLNSAHRLMIAASIRIDDCDWPARLVRCDHRRSRWRREGTRARPIQY